LKKIKTKTIKPLPEVSPTVPTSDWPLLVFFSVLAVFFSLAFVFSTIIPLLQMTTYLKGIRTGWVQKVMKNDIIFTPYTYAQRVIRYEFLKYLEEQNIGASDISLLDGAILKMEESVQREGSSPYQYIRLGRAMEKKVEILRDPTYFKQAEVYYKKAISLSPKRQETSYAYGLSLIRQGRDRADEAVLVLTSALDKTIPISYYYLGLAEFNRGRETYTQSLEHLEFYFETKQVNPDQRASQDVYEKLFQYFYSTQDKQRVLISAARIKSLVGDPKGDFSKVIDFINKNNQLPTVQFNQTKLSGVVE
jgi:tetratricopeptide (TPR) repeat protein